MDEENQDSNTTTLLPTDARTDDHLQPAAVLTERFVGRVEELCRAGPLMLVVDDLQWADSATVVACGRLARLTRRLPLLLVGLERPVPQRDDLRSLRRVAQDGTTIDLGRLSENEAVELVTQVVGGPPGSRLKRLSLGANGNPLYLTELLDALRRVEALRTENGYVEFTGDDLPGTLAAAIADRLDFLTEPVRHLLRLGALLGGDLSLLNLAAVSGRAVQDLLGDIDFAVTAGVLDGREKHLVFRHPLIQSALYEETPAPTRPAWHRHAAAALAAQGARPETVARQLLLALYADSTVDEWMISWLSDAGQHLINRDPSVAIPLLRWAIDGTSVANPAYGALACRLAEALYRTGDAAAGTTVAVAASAHITRLDHLVELCRTITQCLLLAGHSDEPLREVENMSARPDLEPRHRAQLLVLTARVHRNLGHAATAVGLAHDALAVATAVQDRSTTAWALTVLALAHGMLGDEVKALQMFDRALAAAEGDPALADLKLLLYINKAIALGDTDQHTEAIRLATHARELAATAGNAIRLSQARNVLAGLFFDCGRWNEAADEITANSSGHFNPVVQCSDRSIDAVIRLHRDDPHAGADLVTGELSAARLPKSQVIGTLALARSLAREQAGAPTEALTVLMDGLSKHNEELEQATDLLADTVRLAVTVNNRSAAQTALERAKAAARNSSAPHRKAVSLHCSGLLNQDLADLNAAAAFYKTAGRPLGQAQALEASAILLAASGDLTDADVAINDAASLYATLGAHWDLARVRSHMSQYRIPDRVGIASRPVSSQSGHRTESRSAA